MKELIISILKLLFEILKLIAAILVIVIVFKGGFWMNVKKIRNEKELSIRELSELSGVPKRTIEDIERFDRCKVDTAIKLADALGVTLDELCR